MMLLFALFVASTIVGVSHEDQLAEIFAAIDMKLDASVMKKVNEVTRKLMYPMG